MREPMQLSEQQIERLGGLVEPTVGLADGDLVPLAGRRVKAIWTPGHTPGHLCLHDQDNDLILTGDHVLPRISPNIGLQPHNSKPTLGPYLTSLRKLTRYDPAEVLPAHEWRFRNLGVRIGQLLEHHRQRCAEIVMVMDALGPCSAWQVTERLTWSRGWAGVQGLQRRAALAETAAHLSYLTQDGRISSAAVDADEPTLYSGQS